MTDRWCLPRCFEPSWPDCSDPVPLCCFHLALPDDMCVELEEREGDWSCSTTPYLCDDEWITRDSETVTNLSGTIGLPFIFGDDLDQWGSGWWGMNQHSCGDLFALMVDAHDRYENWWSEHYDTPFPGNGIGWLYIAVSCNNGKVTIEGRIGLEAPVTGVPSGCADRFFFRNIVWSSPYWRVIVNPDWWKTIDSYTPGLYGGPLEIPIIEGSLLGGGTPPFGPLKLSISHACDWVPCGDPLDCFASCISGSVDCDGVTPAHRPVIYFTYIGVGCCLSGTYPMVYGTGPLGGIGYHLTPTKVCTQYGTTFTMDAVLKCGVQAGVGGVNHGVGTNTANLFIRVMDSEGNIYYYVATVSLSCTGGALNGASGTIGDSQCGLSISGTAGWAISG